jgi:hypothetical protein
MTHRIWWLPSVRRVTHARARDIPARLVGKDRVSMISPVAVAMA